MDNTTDRASIHIQSLPLEIHNEIQSFCGPVERLALSSSCRQFRIAERDIESQRELVKLDRVSKYQSFAMAERDGHLRVPVKPCSGCQTLHPKKDFTSLELGKDGRERECLGNAGWLKLHPGWSMKLSELLKYVSCFSSDRNPVRYIGYRFSGYPSTAGQAQVVFVDPIDPEIPETDSRNRQRQQKQIQVVKPTTSPPRSPVAPARASFDHAILRLSQSTRVSGTPELPSSTSSLRAKAYKYTMRYDWTLRLEIFDSVFLDKDFTAAIRASDLDVDICPHISFANPEIARGAASTLNATVKGNPFVPFDIECDRCPTRIHCACSTRNLAHMYTIDEVRHMGRGDEVDREEGGPTGGGGEAGAGAATTGNNASLVRKKCLTLKVFRTLGSMEGPTDRRWLSQLSSALNPCDKPCLRAAEKFRSIMESVA